MSGPATPQSSSPSRRASVGRSAFLVAAGIFLSRIFGLVRDRVFGHFFGIGDAADAFRGAMRIPNLLQNLFGEGVLSASFIPVYARLLAEGDEEEAGRVAGAVFSLLALVTSVLVLAGVLATPWLIDLIVPGFKGETRLLAIELVRIFFPGVGLLVLSTWCLGILNSHGKFFLSYVSPVIWNLSIIVALLWFGNHAALPQLAMNTAWASVVGSALQFLVQVPFVIKLAPGLRFFVTTLGENVRVVLRNFVPAFMGRGVNQLSAYVDTLLASFLPAGSVAALFNAQTLNMLPVSLFGMSVSAAELPAMSSTLGQEQEIAAALRTRIAASTRRIGFFVVPSAIAFLALGDVIAAAIFQTGAFRRADSDRVWAILAGSAVGLVASTVGRLYSSAYYALRDTRTPLKFATIRVLLTAGLGYVAALLLPGWLGVNPIWGAAGLTATAGFAAWIEFLLLRRGMNARIGRSEFPTTYFVKLWSAAIIAAGLAWGVRMALRPHQPQVAALVILIPYGVAYLTLAMAFGIDEARSFTRRLARGRP